MKTHELQVWQSAHYGITIIVSVKGSRSGFRLCGAKLWAGQGPKPKLLKTFDVPQEDFERILK